MIPSKSQWKRWSLPSKLTAIGTFVGILGVALSILFYVFPNIRVGETRFPSLPDGSGWILVGDYDDSLDVYVRGPLYKVIASSYPEPSQFPRKGEIIRLKTERNVVIADYKDSGTKKLFQPPWQKNILGDKDYTGIKLYAGSIVEVRDVSMGHFSGMPFVVWVRIGQPP